MSDKPSRVLVVTSTFPRWRDDTEPGFVLELCRYLHGRGLEIDVVAPHAPGARRYELMDGIHVYRYRYFITRLQTLAYAGGILSNLRSQPLKFLLVPWLLLCQGMAVCARLKAARYRAIHAHWIIPQGVVCALARTAARREDVALICTSHGGDLYALNNIVFRRIKKWVINRCTRLCVVSRAMARQAERLGVDAEKISVMPMGVDLEAEFRPAPEVQRRAHGLIFVGRLVEKKGAGVLLEAMTVVIKAVPDVELLIVGDGPLRPLLERWAMELAVDANVRFCGAVPHARLPALYSSVSIAVTPSIIAASGDQEGLGLVMVEAMGCGCAVVASSLEAIRDVVDAETGLLVPPGDPAALAEAILRLLHDPALCRDLAARGRDKARRQFDWLVSGERYFGLLADDAGDGSLRPG